MRLKRRKNTVPDLQMTAMPDLIFTILFFFMIVTHMRENTVQLTYVQPAGEELKKVGNKRAVIDIYVGKNGNDDSYKIQVNNRITPLSQLHQILEEEKKHTSADTYTEISASLQADKEVPMYVIQQIKLAMREANILKINYSGTAADK